MHNNQLHSETWFQPYRKNYLPPLSKEFKNIAFPLLCLALFLLCAFFLHPTQTSKSFQPSSINTELKNKAMHKLQLNDIDGAMVILNNAITIEKNKFDFFDPRVQQALNQQNFDPQILEALK